MLYYLTGKRFSAHKMPDWQRVAIFTHNPAYSTVHYTTLHYTTVYSTVQYSTVYISTVQYSAVQYGVQHSALGGVACTVGGSDSCSMGVKHTPLEGVTCMLWGCSIQCWKP